MQKLENAGNEKNDSVMSRLRQQGLVIDGAMGTMLMQAGLENGKAPESWVLEKPEEVVKVHRGYADAGADILITNTLGGNSIKLKKSGLDRHMAKINRKAAELARSTAGDRCFVAGNMGPTGEMLQPVGPLSEAHALEAFTAQARVLAESGVDLFLAQTFFSLKELRLAVQGIQSVSDLPIFASLTFQETPKGFATLMGDGVKTGMNRLADAGCAVVGTNCSLGSEPMIRLAEIVRKSVDIPVMAEPNAGMPEVVDGRTVYNEDAGDFARNLKRIKALGVEVVGGCCGTTPAHIRETLLNI